jgi:hypothetical protein
VHALDPDQQGEVLWQSRIGTGGSLGWDSVGTGFRPGHRVRRSF